MPFAYMMTRSLRPCLSCTCSTLASSITVGKEATRGRADAGSSFLAFSITSASSSFPASSIISPSNSTSTYRSISVSITTSASTAPSLVTATRRDLRFRNKSFTADSDLTRQSWKCNHTKPVQQCTCSVRACSWPGSTR